MSYLSVQESSVPYYEDPITVFSCLCQNTPNTLLLESAELTTKHHLKSLIVLDTALKIICRGQTVWFIPMTSNGKAVINHIQIKLGQFLTQSALSYDATTDTLIATFAPIDETLEENERLKSPTVFDGLRAVLSTYQKHETPIFLGGMFAYDLVQSFIQIDETLHDDGLTSPDYCFYLAQHLLTVNHTNQTASLQTFCFDQTDQEALIQAHQNLIATLPNLTTPTVANQQADKFSHADIKVSVSDEDFCQNVTLLKQHIRSGDVFQIVPSRRFFIPCPQPLLAYKQLKITNPSPYMFFMHDEEFDIFGASPESALKFSPNTRTLELYPIAGSRPRGFDKLGNIDCELDARLELELRLDQKEQSEHLMLVDLARNDVARVCQAGTRYVKSLMQVDRYSHVMHLVSKVVGNLRPDLDALHAYQACMNMGTLTGAPKIKAMQLLYQHEKVRRHSYGGAIGYLTSDGTFDTCIVIRSAFVQQGMAYVQAGCGVVLDSEPIKESNETRQKAQAVINAIMYSNNHS